MFTDTLKSITAKDLEDLETALKIVLPNDFKQHYLKYNGGYPEKEHFYMEDYDTFLWVDFFRSIKYSNEDKTVESAYDFFVIDKKVIPINFLPFASDLGGNQICINIDTNVVYIVYMDVGNPIKNQDSIRKIACNFQYFLDNLEEKDV